MDAYFKYVNANGGVNGRKIKLVIKNDGYKVTDAVNKTVELLSRDKVFALVGSLGTANNIAVSNAVDLDGQGIPSLYVNSGFSGFANKSTYKTMFPLFPTYYMETKVLGEYIKKNFPTKKVGIIYQDDDFGDDALAGLAKAGVKPVAAVPYASLSQSAATAATWVSKLKAAQADLVIMYGVTSAAAFALSTSYALGYKPQWIIDSVGGVSATLQLLGIPAPLLNGVITSSFLPTSTDTKDEYIKLFQTINTKYNAAGTKFDDNVVTGMNTAMMTVAALQAAGKNLTRSGVIKAIETKGKTFPSASLAQPQFSTTSHVGYNGFWIGTYDATGTLKPETGKYKIYTTDSGSGAVKVSTWKRPAMPAKGLPK
jgi:ABC-type branched-subunit amino acid transport system substrate-binding protein